MINRRRSEQGFGLLELMIAVMVLAVMTVGLNSIWTTAVLAKERAWQETVAAELAAEKVAQLEVQPFAAVVSETAKPFDGQFAEYRSQVNVTLISGANSATGLKQIRVVVWHVSAPQRQISLVTYFAER